MSRAPTGRVEVLHNWPFAVAALLFAILIGGAGWLFFAHQRDAARRTAQETLSSIADLKASQIAAWMKERRSDAKTSFYKAAARQFLADPENASVRGELQKWMAECQRTSYRTVALFDAAGTVRMSVPKDESLQYACVSEHVQKALHAREVIVTDLHSARPSDPIHLSLLVPVGIRQNADQHADGVLLLIIDPYEFLYPLVQTWPTSSPTAETLLVRRDGDDVLFLNDLRHQKGAALKLRIPITRTDVPAVRAVLGERGVFSGPDYRETPVVATAREIPNTNWLMIAKVDQEEIYAPVRNQAWTAGIFTALLLVAALLTVGLFWRQHGLSVVQQELAARTLAEEALRASEERFRLLVEGVQDYAIVMLDTEGSVISWNNGAQRIKGYRADEILGKNFSCFYLADAIQQKVPERELSEALEKGRFEDEGWRVRKDGSRFMASVIITAVRDENSTLRGFSKVTRDITARKQVEEALRLSEEKFATAFANNPAAIALTRLDDGVFLDVNRTWEKLVGFGRHEAIGHSAREMGVWPTTEATAQFVQVLREKGSLDGWEQIFIRKSGEPLVTQLSAQVLTMQGEAVVLSALLDVTERKHIEDEVHRLNAELDVRVQQRTAELEAVNKELEAFSYSVSHDLRAPLRHVQGFVNLLRKNAAGAMDSKSLHYMETIANSALQMGNLIDDLLIFSRMGRQELRRDPVDMKQIVAEAQASLAAETEGRKIEWKIGALPLVNGDRSMLRQVWTNLLSNAVKYTRGRAVAQIEVAARIENGQHVMFVKDNGVGFDMRYADKLFRVFQRLHGADEFEGTGIGLANVRRIVARHGGRTWAEGEVEVGATVYFTLPAAEQPALTAEVRATRRGIPRIQLTGTVSEGRTKEG
ncbi:MAG TPA: PAS domain S-box protein [Planctomycetota bacterium]|jgi:PAS domain S-box-containing protein